MVNKINKLVFLFLIFSGCGNSNSQTNATLSLGEFNPYYNSFVTLASMYHKALPHHGLIIKFSKLTGSILGQCTMSTNIIEIDYTAWPNLSSIEKKLLLYHEMGHCLLGREHNNVVTNKRPVSIMNAYLLSEVYFNTNPKGYLQELFQ